MGVRRRTAEGPSVHVRRSAVGLGTRELVIRFCAKMRGRTCINTHVKSRCTSKWCETSRDVDSIEADGLALECVNKRKQDQARATRYCTRRPGPRGSSRTESQEEAQEDEPYWV